MSDPRIVYRSVPAGRMWLATDVPLPDPRSLWLAVGIVGLVFGVAQIAMSRAGYPSRPLVVWGGCGAIGGIGALLFVSKGMLPPLISSVLANLLLVVYWVGLWAGLRAFSRRRAPWPTAFAPLVVAVVLQLVSLAFPSTVVRTYLVAGVGVWVTAAMALDTRRDQRAEPLRMRRVLFALTVLWAVPLIARPTRCALDPARCDPFGVDPFNAVVTSVIVGLTAATGAVLVFMVLERVQNELLRASVSDPLTGALNRQGMIDAVAREECDPDAPGAVFMADLDDFKAINDRYGHAVGDRLLRCFVETCRRSLPTGAVLSRRGGDEFCVVLPGTPAPRARAVAERIVADFVTAAAAITSGAETGVVGAGGVVGGVVGAGGSGGALAAAGPQLPRVGVSIGVTDLAGGFDIAVERADRALYAVKKDGRGGVRLG